VEVRRCRADRSSSSARAPGGTCPLQVGQAGVHHVGDHRQRVLPVEFAEQSFDYVGVAELSHQVIVHFQH